MTGQPPNGDPVGAGLDGLRADDAAAARRRARWVAAQTSEEQDLRDRLAALAGHDVVLLAADGTELRGRAVSVGADAVEVVAADRTFLVRLDHLAAVRTEATTGRATGPAARPGGWTLAEVLEALVDSGRPVQLGLVGPHAVAGEISSVGRTVTVRTAEGTTAVDPRRVVTVRLTGT